MITHGRSVVKVATGHSVHIWDSFPGGGANFLDIPSNYRRITSQPGSLMNYDNAGFIMALYYFANNFDNITRLDRESPFLNTTVSLVVLGVIGSFTLPVYSRANTTLCFYMMHHQNCTPWGTSYNTKEYPPVGRFFSSPTNFLIL